MVRTSTRLDEGGSDSTEESGAFRRITVLAASAFERELHARASEYGVFSYLCSYCPAKSDSPDKNRSLSLVRVEILADARATQRMLAYLREHRSGPMSLTATVEAVR